MFQGRTGQQRKYTGYVSDPYGAQFLYVVYNQIEKIPFGQKMCCSFAVWSAVKGQHIFNQFGSFNQSLLCIYPTYAPSSLKISFFSRFMIFFSSLEM